MDAVPARLLAHPTLCVPVLGLGVVHVAVVAELGKVLGVEELGENDEVGPLFHRLVHEAAGPLTFSSRQAVRLFIWMSVKRIARPFLPRARC